MGKYIGIIAKDFVSKNITFCKIDLNSDFSDLINKKFDIIIVIEHLESPRHLFRIRKNEEI
jgi:hypothetical protein